MKNPFIKKLCESKLYLISFIITVIVLGYGLSVFMKNSDGFITKRNKQQLEILQKIKEAKAANEGYYSHKVTLNEKIDIGTCSISSYDIIYDVKNDKFIKYFSNNCLGVIKLGEEEGIVIDNFSFTVDNRVFDKDSSITGLIENTNSSVNLYFYANSIILLSDDDLILLNNNRVAYNSKDNYENKGGNISKRYYKDSHKEDTFKYIVFYNEEEVPCYDKVDKEHANDKLYEIYQITYNKAFDKFDEPQQLIARSKGDYCLNFENDIEVLKQ